MTDWGKDKSGRLREGNKSKGGEGGEGGGGGEGGAGRRRQRKVLPSRATVQL